MDSFVLHWSRIPDPPAAHDVPVGYDLLALWPAPVNPDVCFTAAGFKDFGDHDAEWDTEASAVLERLLIALAAYGEPKLVSPPLSTVLPWYQRLFQLPTALPLQEQIEWPLHWDSLPSCHVTFGSLGVALRGGHGHHLFWLTLPRQTTAHYAEFVRQLAAGHPVFQTDLQWEFLR